MQRALTISNNDDESVSTSDDEEVLITTTHSHDSPIPSATSQKRALEYSLCPVLKKMKPVNSIDQSI